MQISNDTRSHYERIGGAEKVRALVQRFYQIMDATPEMQDLRKMHAASLKGSEEKLFMFLSGWMNGPQLFMEKFGHPKLRQRHLPFAIGDKERDQWMQCMTQAMNDVVEDEGLRKELLAAIGKVADFMRNKA
ncbi:MAG: group II truncated hemoglobin [Gammaproteobacteria bacterium]|nr:group II truncated hemoglobin [Gammaproteobacteria bacterium]